MSRYEIVEVKNRENLKEFLNLPLKIFPDRNGLHVQPLNAIMKMQMGKLDSAHSHFYIARQNGEAVARIGVKIHRHHNKEALHFGFFECVEGHKEAAILLFQKARAFRSDLHFKGPFHFRLEDPYVGVLIEGFEHEPYFLMPYNPPYYDEYIKAAGLTTAMDLFTYEAYTKNLPPETIVENAKSVKAKGYQIRTLNMKKLRDEATTIARIFNDALSKNWGYEEFLDDQVDEMVSLFKLFIDPRVVLIVHKDGKDVGCLIMLPNYNPIIKSGNGKITPKVIWDFFRKKGKLLSLRGYALGVYREFHGQGLASLIVDEAWKAGESAGYTTCEISWILASNGPMNELSKHMGGKQSKTYRIYEQKV